MTLRIKRNDTAVTLTDALTVGGSPQNLTGAAVSFHMVSDTTTVTGAASIVSAAAGTVSYTVSATDLAVAGTYQQEWQVTFGDSTVLTFPSNGYNRIVVLPDLA
jgi:hypothetical protein